MFPLAEPTQHVQGVEITTRPSVLQKKMDVLGRAQTTTSVAPQGFLTQQGTAIGA